MKKIILALLSTACLSANVQQKMPLNALLRTHELYGDVSLLSQNQNGFVVSLGDFTNETQWNLHILAMNTYFEQAKSKVNVLVFLTNTLHKTNITNALAKNDSLYTSLTFVFVENANDPVYTAFNYKLANGVNNNAILVINNQDYILKKFDAYNCEGEKLKELEYACFPSHFNAAQKLQNDSLVVGQKAPLALLGDTTVNAAPSVVSFYPAFASASCWSQSTNFSTLVYLPMPAKASTNFSYSIKDPSLYNQIINDPVLFFLAPSTPKPKSVLSNFVTRGIVDMASQLEKQQTKTSNVKVVMVSSSATGIPKNWSGAKENDSYKHIADTTGKISAAFGSLTKSKSGAFYSDRTVFVLDKKGIIRYINYDYDVKRDFKKLQEELAKVK